MPKCKCGFKFSGAGEFRNCEALDEEKLLDFIIENVKAEIGTNGKAGISVSNDSLSKFCQHFAQPKRLSVEEIKEIIDDTCKVANINNLDLAQAIYAAQGGQER